MEKKNIKVIGDIMLDKWIYGKYEKNSAEGKLKVFEEIKTELSLGGAGFLCSNLKSKEVAQLINVSPRSVETARYRVKKKIGLDKEENLYDFLSNL